MSLSSSERVVLDATLMVTPAADVGLALQLGAGQLHVFARLADDHVYAPTGTRTRVRTSRYRSPPPASQSAWI